jgi:hypothetical protein
MNRGSHIRAALAVVTLLMQFALPFAHGTGSAVDSRIPAHGSALALTVASPHAATASAHDPRLCCACIALHQMRSGVGRTPTALAHSLAASLPEFGRESALVLPRTPDLVAAAPRAPPLHPLAFA